MIDERFADHMRANTGAAVIMAGSYSDKSHIDGIVASLAPTGLPYDVRVFSAHKELRQVADVIDEYNDIGGTVAYIGIAGGTDALSGALSFHALGPVISCPPDAPNESCLKNPPGSANVYLPYAESVGPYLVKLFGEFNPALAKQAQGASEIRTYRVAITPPAEPFSRLKTGRVVLLGGSFEELKRFEKNLDELAVPYETQRPHNHQLYFSPGEAAEIVRSYDGITPLLFITTEFDNAASEVAMSGRAAIVCNARIDADALRTDMPKAALAVIRRPENAVRFAMQLFSDITPAYRQRIIGDNAAKVAKLKEKDVEFQRAYAMQQRR